METRSCPSMDELHGLARVMGMKYFRHLSKLELHQALQRQMQYAKRAHASAVGKSKKKRKKGKKTKAKYWWRKTTKTTKASSGLNTVDPIMLTELGPHTFRFVRPNGTIVVYNIESLVQYILATGDFSEPETRLPFPDAMLAQLDAEAKAAGLELGSVAAAKQDKAAFEQLKIKRDGLLGLERCAGEVVTEMLEVIEDDDGEEGEMRLVMEIFPNFADLYSQLKMNDAAYAAQCHKHFVEYLQGPPNRPTIDESGLYHIVLDFMAQTAAGPSHHRPYA
ncbi:hypothetical protein SPRG_02565 [Saprolegnia parasitica CBS 223.65]|uniref:Uncharacterized protein n=1 Tax=Saprolegnia parasitica (strain CBS 223.65) TaxID=695850 RepID=A0A067CQT9_SAPPC|nr:hypothetical protein SPRG_02565 [Saprolegnia parasitica CBS 223.65]KDO32873.1 hypothetical protein SPRG_02565 [Saprolegnia parasitica CBS 223.65]|eukprot:XP_012196524.1 hypothetical protein SPRG_02565 [Saprolegnia parasitica CBS 223.65]